MGVNMCMGMRMGLHGREWVCMDESLEREMGMRCGWIGICLDGVYGYENGYEGVTSGYEY